jgi:hypothetical protein
MEKLKRSCVVLLVISAAACGSTATGPSPNPGLNPTRIIALSGNLAFGNVSVGETANAMLTITNSGNSPLVVSGITITSGLEAIFSPDWTKGTIAAGGSQQVTSRFAPAVLRNYSGTVTVNGNQTTGTNSIAISGSGVGPTFTVSGVVDDGTPRQSGRIPNTVLTVLDGINAGKSTSSDNNGSYALTGLTPGTFIISATFSNYETAMKTVDVAANMTVDFTLTRLPPVPEAPEIIGAMCNDGTSSTSTISGACAGNGGLSCWKYSDGTCTNP